VTFDGQPIPAGEIILTPDAAKGNSGPQGVAEIRDGKYDTAWGKPVRGAAGGPTVFRVTGMTGPQGKALCEYELKADLPREDTTYDIKVPKSAAPKRQAPEI